MVSLYIDSQRRFCRGESPRRARYINIGTKKCIIRRSRSIVGRTRRNLCATSKNAYRYIRVHNATRYTSHFVSINLPSLEICRGRSHNSAWIPIDRKTCLRAPAHMAFLCSPEISVGLSTTSHSRSQANSNTRGSG